MGSWCLLTCSALRATSVDQAALGLRCASVTTGAFLREPERPSVKQALQGFVMSWLCELGCLVQFTTQATTQAVETEDVPSRRSSNQRAGK